MIRAVYNVLKVLNSDAEPRQISLAVALAMIAGFTPLLSLHNLLVLLLVLVLRVNLSAFLLGLAFFSGIAYLLDPIFHRIGLAVLTAPSMEPSWTSLYNSTFWRLERFNNSIVMGSLLSSLLLVVPIFLMSNWAIIRYRAHFLVWVQKYRLTQILFATRLGGDL